MEEDMPTMILTVSIVMIMLAIGVFAFYVVNSEIGFTEIQTEEFAVADPTVAKDCKLDYSIQGIISVQQYDGYNWNVVGAGDYTVAGQTVTVLPSGMTG